MHSSIKDSYIYKMSLAIYTKEDKKKYRDFKLIPYKYSIARISIPLLLYKSTSNIS